MFNSNGAFATDPDDGPFLDGPQQANLHRQRHFTDFIEKKRSPVRLLDNPLPTLIAAGEGAFLIAKKGLQSRERQDCSCAKFRGHF